MSRLMCMQGLPASGKSTRAKALMAEYGNAVRINRDLLRTMLHCDVWSGKKEGITLTASRALTRQMLSLPDVGCVIIDDTNLSPGVVESWRHLAHETESRFDIVRMDTPMEECIRRDQARAKEVGAHVIVGMALKYGLYPMPEKGFVLCDIDGTLADITRRKHFVDGEGTKDWDGFFANIDRDTPREDIALAVATLQREGYDVILVSGRPEWTRDTTELWLYTHCPDLDWSALFMRRTGDHRPDTVVKEEILTTYFPDLSKICCVYDDRPSVIRMWESHGLTVVNCGDGTEF